MSEVFKDFATIRQYRDGSVIFQGFLNSVFMDRYNVGFSQFVRESPKFYDFFIFACYEFIFMKKGCIQWMFVLFRNAFHIDRYVFGLVRGSTDLLHNLE